MTHAPNKIAIIGCGSSGLICLKTALAKLADWEVVCFEKSDRITGCWGNPYPDFVSTSTKYTTQFACFPECDASVESDSQHRVEFYRGGEYGEYLNRFADAFQLRPHIKLRQQVERLTRAADVEGWSVTYRATDSPAPSVTEHFDAVVICTGLAAQTKEIRSEVSALCLSDLNAPHGIANIRNERIVVFGGGESAVDFAVRLSQPELGNTVYLSLRSGVRVSPRYHPIRGVPSDFLRNRQMLSIHPDLRNWIGQRFVEARILHQERFEKYFPSISLKKSGEQERKISDVRKEWAYKLTKAAKDELFNMFHNKSDDFLDHIAKGQISIVGPPVDSNMQTFHQFQSEKMVHVSATRILPAIGFKSTLHAIAGDSIRLADFYLGCCHETLPSLFLVGFARPIIGNIPTISEMQAAYVCGLIGGRYFRPERIIELNAADQREHKRRFSKLDLDAVYPVEMFTYCDRLSRQMNTYPSLRSVGSLRSWCRMQLSPATTMHYHYNNPQTRGILDRAPVYMPSLLVLFLLLLKPLDWMYRLIQRLRGS